MYSYKHILCMACEIEKWCNKILEKNKDRKIYISSNIKKEYFKRIILTVA